MFKLKIDDVIQTLWTINSKWLFAVIEMIRGEQPNESEEMVAMQMADKNMIDPLKFEFAVIEFE